MKGLSMKTGFKIIAVAGSLLLAGCMAENTLSSDKVEYTEIRVDVFSHYWLVQKQLATKSVGSKLIFNASSEEAEAFDTLALLNSSLNKSADLPAHVIVDEWGFYETPRVFYTAAREPKTFQCYFETNGKRLISADSILSGSVLRRHLVQYDEDGDLMWDEESWFKLQDAPVVTSVFSCGYAPGKGFFLGNEAYDYFEGEPGALGTLVIRY
jgi:hypothetical protein